MKNKLPLFSVIASVLFAVFGFISRADAFIWIEQGHGDAGNLLNNAQIINEEGTLETIQGRIKNSPGVDMYQIWLSGGDAFSAIVTDAEFDTQLFLFDSSGFGIYANDNLAKGNPLSALPTGGFSPDEAGLYYLAISRYDRNPRNSDGRIFKNLPRYAVHDADGPGYDSPITGWSKDDENDGAGNYSISLSGAYGITTTPEPATMALFISGLAGLGMLRRKRKT